MHNVLHIHEIELRVPHMGCMWGDLYYSWRIECFVFVGQTHMEGVPPGFYPVAIEGRFFATAELDTYAEIGGTFVIPKDYLQLSTELEHFV